MWHESNMKKKKKKQYMYVLYIYIYMLRLWRRPLFLLMIIYSIEYSSRADMDDGIGFPLQFGGRIPVSNVDLLDFECLLVESS